MVDFLGLLLLKLSNLQKAVRLVALGLFASRTQRTLDFLVLPQLKIVDGSVQNHK